MTRRRRPVREPTVHGRFGGLCNSYEHVGQHGSADYRGVVAKTRPAKRKEYHALAAELRSIGYELVIRAKSPEGEIMTEIRYTLLQVSMWITLACFYISDIFT